MNLPIPITPTLTMDMHGGTTSETVTQGQIDALQVEVHRLRDEYSALTFQLWDAQNLLSILRGRFLLQERERLNRQKAPENATAVGPQKGRW